MKKIKEEEELLRTTSNEEYGLRSITKIRTGTIQHAYYAKYQENRGTRTYIYADDTTNEARSAKPDQVLKYIQQKIKKL